MKNAFVTLICGLLMGCGHANQIRINAPEVDSGALTVVSIKSGSTVANLSIQGSENLFGASEIGLGTQSLRMNILDHTGGVFSATLESDFSSDFVNVNALTTLASCRGNYFASEETQIQHQNELIAKQFSLPQLQEVDPNMNFSKMQVFDDAAAYGILLGSFDTLAKNLEIPTSTLINLLCDDVSHDGKFDGVGKNGEIQQEYSNYDEQVLKAKYGSAIHEFGEKNLSNAIPYEAFANEISLSMEPELFAMGIIHYSFDL
ncbi:MAG: hypothetical protein R2877_00805 [Bdellovibrionota bacterium]